MSGSTPTRRGRHRRGPLVACVAAAIALAGSMLPAGGAGASRDTAPAAPAAPAGPAAPSRAGVDLPVVAQGFELAAGGTWTVTVQLPEGTSSTALGADGRAAEVVVRSFPAVIERVSIAKLRSGELVLPATAADDSVTVPLDVVTADPRVGRPGADQLSLSIPTDAAPAAAGDALLHVDGGVVPVEVEVRVDAAVVAHTLTFVHRAPAPGDPELEAFPVAVLMAQTSAPSVIPDGAVTVSDATHAELADLVTALEGADARLAAVDPSLTLPRAVVVQPASLAALQAEDPALADRLIDVMSRSEVLAAPQLPLDVSAVAAAGRQQTYTEWLRAGEASLTGAVPGVRADRSLYLTDTELSDPALRYLADTGIDVVVMGPDLYATTQGNIADYGDPTWLQTIELSDGSSVPVLRIDPHLADRLAEHPAQPVAAAVDLMAEVMAYRDFLDSLGRPLRRTGLLLARADGGVIDPALLGEVAARLAEVSGIEVVTPGDLVSSMETQLVDGSVRPLTLPNQAGPDLTARWRTIDELTYVATSVGQMLPDDDPHLASWDATIRTMPTTALTDGEVEAAADAIRADFDLFRTGVVGPQPFKFTLTGRTGTIRFALRNTTDVPLTVVVRLAGAKLTFPENDQRYTIPAQGQIPVRAEAESRSNGTSQVIVRILTPNGSQLGADIVLTAQVRALTGLGTLLTGAALLVLATWWVRHWRLSRRRRGAEITSPRHPARRGAAQPGADTSDGEAADTAESGEVGAAAGAAGAAAGAAGAAGHAVPDVDADLAPDAAASSLPPS